MVKTSFLFLAAATLALADTQTPQNFSGDFVIKVNYSYLLSKPEGYEADAKKKWPLVIFLHGSGERGSDLEQLKKHGPPKLIAAGEKLPAVIASLQCPKNELWNPHGVKAVTDHLIKTERIDTSRVYLTGLSMGGFGTWETAFEYPETYAAIAPVCGGAGVRWVTAERLKSMPCWIFHGDKDGAVPVENSQKIFDALKKINAPVKLTIYPGVGHDSWTQTYANPEFWEWLFAQKRG
ncbi:MAG: prolyl oligopeptidase family serine peptidase [Prosthecobacter sp.]|jgi:predicted peptidase|uniref:carboxylesterase family protein n=1 Tax=Prosthecobacter sp. TaxID=1965333 RepID=UPI001A011B2A|nr:prolyl oligopeptidase family serine peptidase [Prosthecobacter sp.]MBE2283443.1 prolyl oligopeptidase family serine peptidase [Prosthecobacter sp.]